MANWETRYVKIIKEIALEENIELKSFDDWAFYLRKDGRQAYIYGYQFGLDSGAVAGVLKDKAACYSMLKMAGIPAVPHWCIMNPLAPEFSSLDSAWKFMEDKLLEYGRLVIKDNQGTGGRSVSLVSDMSELEKAAHEIFTTAQSAAVSPYENIIAEYRAVVLDGKVRLLFRKDRPLLEGDGKRSIRQLYSDFLADSGIKAIGAGISDGALKRIMSFEDGWNAIPAEGECINLSWKHNLGQGAQPVILEENRLDDKMADIIHKVCGLFDLKFASIDMITTEEETKILEINGGVMMENIAGASSEAYIKAKEIYREAIKKMLCIGEEDA